MGGQSSGDSGEKQIKQEQQQQQMWDLELDHVSFSTAI